MRSLHRAAFIFAENAGFGFLWLRKFRTSEACPWMEHMFFFCFYDIMYQNLSFT